MKFVVPIPLWLYILGVLFMLYLIGAAFYVMAIAVVVIIGVALLCLLWEGLTKAPGETIAALLLLGLVVIAIVFWRFTLIALLAVVLLLVIGIPLIPKSKESAEGPVERSAESSVDQQPASEHHAQITDQSPRA